MKFVIELDPEMSTQDTLTYMFTYVFSMDQLSTTQELVENVALVKGFMETPVVRKRNATSFVLPLHGDLIHTPANATGPGKAPVASAAGTVECPDCSSKVAVRNSQHVGGHILHNKVDRVCALRVQGCIHAQCFVGGDYRTA